MNILTAFQNLQKVANQNLIGQPHLVESLLLALLADGHILAEGPPGVAKTRAIKLLSKGIEGQFHRIQFTPDLLPSDLTGTEVYYHQTGEFKFQPGPIFHNLLLADEINRAPAKVQSALLEAMAEKQVTIGKISHPLPDVFLVMATQNPIEHEGTYPLPEAQLDRFLLHVKVDYPDKTAEKEILNLARIEATQLGSRETAYPIETVVTQAILFEARKEALASYVAPMVESYLIELIFATREPHKYGDDLKRWIEWGASPRATIALDRVARSLAWLRGQDFVSPDLVQSVLPDILRHRLVLSYEAQAEGITPDKFISEIIARVPVP
ncbi:MAG: AAA family ATPase [Gammaproteobacteria bacterium]